MLQVIHDYKDPKGKKLPKSWKSVTRLGEKLLKGEETLTMSLNFPEEWRMEKFDMHSPTIPVVKLIARDPLFMVARQLMNPRLIYGYSDHIRYKSFREDNDIGERLHGCIMSSVWAEKTERSLLNRNDRGTILPLIFNSDGVALGKTNQQMTTVLAANGLMDDKLLEQPISKICLGYLPKLPFSEAELVVHLTKFANYSSKTVAQDAINCFKITMQNAYWAMVLAPIREHNKEGSAVLLFAIMFIPLYIGVFMRLLNTPDHAMKVHPYFHSFVGDEPGIKSTLGYLMCGAKRFCIRCYGRAFVETKSLR